MAVSSQRLVISSTPVALNAPSAGGERLLVLNTTSNPVDLGGSGVTAGAGFPLGANATVAFDLDAGGDLIYAIRSTGVDSTIAVLRT